MLSRCIQCRMDRLYFWGDSHDSLRSWQFLPCSNVLKGQQISTVSAKKDCPGKQLKWFWPRHPQSQLWRRPSGIPVLQHGIPIEYLWSKAPFEPNFGRHNIIWVCLKIVYPFLPNGFADHYPVFKWLFHWEYTQHFQTNPYVALSKDPLPPIVPRSDWCKQILQLGIAPGCRSPKGTPQDPASASTEPSSWLRLGWCFTNSQRVSNKNGLYPLAI